MPNQFYLAENGQPITPSAPELVNLLKQKKVKSDSPFYYLKDKDGNITRYAVRDNPQDFREYMQSLSSGGFETPNESEMKYFDKRSELSKNPFSAAAQGAALGVLQGATLNFGAPALIGAGALEPETVSAVEDESPVAKFAGEVVAPGIGIGGKIAKKVLGKASQKFAGEVGEQAVKEAKTSKLIKLGKAFSAVPDAVDDISRKVSAELIDRSIFKPGSLANKVAKGATAGAIEAASYAAGQTVHESALGDYDLTAESFAANMAPAALIGGALLGSAPIAGQMAKGIASSAKNKILNYKNTPMSPFDLPRKQQNIFDALGGTRSERLAYKRQGVPTREASQQIRSALDEVGSMTMPDGSKVVQGLGTAEENVNRFVSSFDQLGLTLDDVYEEAAKLSNEPVASSEELKNKIKKLIKAKYGKESYSKAYIDEADDALENLFLIPNDVKIKKDLVPNINKTISYLDDLMIGNDVPFRKESKKKVFGDVSNYFKDRADDILGEMPADVAQDAIKHFRKIYVSRPGGRIMARDARNVINDALAKGYFGLESGAIKGTTKYGKTPISQQKLSKTLKFFDNYIDEAQVKARPKASNQAILDLKEFVVENRVALSRMPKKDAVDFVKSGIMSKFKSSPVPEGYANKLNRLVDSTIAPRIKKAEKISKYKEAGDLSLSPILNARRSVRDRMKSRRKENPDNPYISIHRDIERVLNDVAVNEVKRLYSQGAFPKQAYEQFREMQRLFHKIYPLGDMMSERILRSQPKDSGSIASQLNPLNFIQNRRASLSVALDRKLSTLSALGSSAEKGRMAFDKSAKEAGDIILSPRRAIKATMRRASVIGASQSGDAKEDVARFSDLSKQNRQAALDSIREQLRGELGDAAPIIAEKTMAMVEQAYDILEEEAPVRPRDMSAMFQAPKPWKASELDAQRFLRIANAVNNPGQELELAASGDLNVKALGVVKKLYPRLYAEAMSSIVEKTYASDKPIDIQTRSILGILMDGLDPTQSPEYIQDMQKAANFGAAKPAENAQGSGGSARITQYGMKIFDKSREAMESPLDRIAQGE
jgi:hypothetical protein